MVGSSLGFLVIIFGLDRVGSGYFLSLGENVGPCPTRHMVRSGWVEVGLGRVFFRWVGRVYRVGQSMIRSISGEHSYYVGPLHGTRAGSCTSRWVGSAPGWCERRRRAEESEVGGGATGGA
jgi:hypothetical protein